MAGQSCCLWLGQTFYSKHCGFSVSGKTTHALHDVVLEFSPCDFWNLYPVLAGDPCLPLYVGAPSHIFQFPLALLFYLPISHSSPCTFSSLPAIEVVHPRPGTWPALSPSLICPSCVGCGLGSGRPSWTTTRHFLQAVLWPSKLGSAAHCHCLSDPMGL